MPTLSRWGDLYIMSESNKSALSRKSVFFIEDQGRIDLTTKFVVGTTDGVKILKIGDKFSELFLIKDDSEKPKNNDEENLEGIEVNIFEMQKSFFKKSLIDVIGDDGAISLIHLWAILRAISENGCRKELEIIIRNDHANIFLVKNSAGVTRIVYCYFIGGGWIISAPPHSPEKCDWIRGNRVISSCTKSTNSS